MKLKKIRFYVFKQKKKDEFHPFLTFLLSPIVDLEDDDLDDIMNNNGQCPVSLSPIS